MKNLINRIKNYEGAILGINIEEEKIKDAIYQNEKIYKCDLLEDRISKENLEKIKEKTKDYEKVVPIRNLGKKYKKKKMDYLICDIDKTEKYMPYILRDIFLVSKKEACFYSKKKEEADLFLEKVKRLETKIEKCKEGKYVFFYLKKKNIPRYKSYLYFFIDEISLFLDKITDFLEK